ncbi:MAG: radical SAM protein [Myxococcota bacterium]
MELRAPPEGFALGLGLTNECDLACGHCYRDPTRLDRLSLDDVRRVLDAVPVRSVNLGTGENGLHPQYAEILDELHARNIKVSITSNGYSIAKLSDAQLARFTEIEVSVDFPTEAEQDRWRAPGNWALCMRALERARALNVRAAVISVMMRTNHRVLAQVAHVAAAHGASFRVNVYQSVRGDTYALTYDEFWTAWRLLLAETQLVVCTEPVVNAVLGRSGPACRSGCGRTTVRVTPRGEVLPCVYWPERTLSVEELRGPILDSEPFRHVREVPEACRACPMVESCAGGCASRRMLRSRPQEPDEYCPFARGESITLLHTPAPTREVLKASSACTTVVLGDASRANPARRILDERA